MATLAKSIWAKSHKKNRTAIGSYLDFDDKSCLKGQKWPSGKNKKLSHFEGTRHKKKSQSFRYLNCKGSHKNIRKEDTVAALKDPVKPLKFCLCCTHSFYQRFWNPLPDLNSGIYDSTKKGVTKFLSWTKHYLINLCLVWVSNHFMSTSETGQSDLPLA